MVGDRAVSSVADVVFGDQVIDIDLVFGAVGGHREALPLDLGKVQGEVGVDDLGDRLIEVLQGDVAADGEAQLVRADQGPRRCRAACAGLYDHAASTSVGDISPTNKGQRSRCASVVAY